VATAGEPVMDVDIHPLGVLLPEDVSVGAALLEDAMEELADHFLLDEYQVFSSFWHA